MDGTNWSLLRRHVNDESLNDQFATHSWPIEGQTKAYRSFRILQTVRHPLKCCSWLFFSEHRLNTRATTHRITISWCFPGWSCMGRSTKVTSKRSTAIFMMPSPTLKPSPTLCGRKPCRSYVVVINTPSMYAPPALPPLST